MKKNNSKRFKPKTRIRKGDKVIVIAGAYKDLDRSREVLEVLPVENKAIVDGVNIVKKHMKPTNDNPNGGIIEQAAPIHLSNLMIADPKTGEPSRVGMTEENGERVRYSKKSGEIIK